MGNSQQFDLNATYNMQTNFSFHFFSKGRTVLHHGTDNYFLCSYDQFVLMVTFFIFVGAYGVVLKCRLKVCTKTH